MKLYVSTNKVILKEQLAKHLVYLSMVCSVKKLNSIYKSYEYKKFQQRSKRCI